jgi:hypothetical protein
MKRRIEIPGDVAAAEHLPDDLDATQREPYAIPSTRRRLRFAVVYVVAAAVAFLTGLVVVGGLLAAVAVWHYASAWHIAVLDPEALETATREVGFPVGHASAVVGFDGIRARPVWNVLVFSGDEPPSRLGLVRVDAVDGHVAGSWLEDVASGPQPPAASKN